MSASWELLSVQVGEPSVLIQTETTTVMSGIRKRPVDAKRVMVRSLNIDGDGQADLRAHGGIDKAIYLYPSDHWSWWEHEIGYTGVPGFAPFGENLTTSGLLETDICIGDRIRWGDALLEVSQPRWPCFKLNAHVEDERMVKTFIDSARCGVYFRVLEEGVAPTQGPLEREFADPHGLSVAQAFIANRDRNADPDLWELVKAHPKLAAAWKR